MTTKQLTQIGAVPWVVSSPQARFTQIGIAPWTAGSPGVRGSQFGVAVWTTRAAGSRVMTLTHAGAAIWVQNVRASNVAIVCIMGG